MESSHVEYNTVRSTCAQVTATFAFNLLSINLGLIIGMPALVIGALRVYDKSILISEEQASWLGGVIFMVQPLGSVVSGFLQDRLGRKVCMMVVNIPQLVAWIMLYQAADFSTLFAAITIMGISIGFMEAPVLSYIGEICEPRLRGVLSTFGFFFFNVGLLIEVLLGAEVDWRTMVLVSCSGPVAAFVALSLVPDSPAWLVTRGRVADAQKAYQWLRGCVSPQDVQKELQLMVAHAQKSRNIRVVSKDEHFQATNKECLLLGGPIDSTDKSTQAPQESMLKTFRHHTVLRPFRLIVIFSIISPCATLTAFRPFFIEILSSMHLPISPYTVLVIGTILSLVGSLSSSLGMRRLGKRGLTFISLTLSIFCCFGIGVYLRYGINAPWIFLVLLGISFYAASLGIMTIPMILISELFPLKGRGLAGGLAAAMGYFIMFIIIKTFYNIVSLFGLSGASIMYGMVGLVGFIYLYLMLPETEGLPLEDIERLYTEKSSNVVRSARRMRKEIDLRRVVNSKDATVESV